MKTINKLALIAAFLFTSVTLSFAQGSISGYSYYFNTNAPYINFLELVHTSDPSITFETDADSTTGYYEFTNIPIGEYKLRSLIVDASIFFKDEDTSDALDDHEHSGWNYLLVNLQDGEVELQNNVYVGESPIPVEFLSQSASVNNNRVIVEWSTSTEVNNERFEIERSLDGLSFEKIGEVKGSGTTTEIQEYSFTDKNLSQSGVVYYRIKQIDHDGKYDYSDVFNINFIGHLNPYLSGEIIIVDGLSTSVNYELVSLNGQIVKQGIVSRTVDVSDINAGLYILRLIENNRVISVSKIVK